MKRILITGSREWSRKHPEPIRHLLRVHGPGVVVHGAARGVDTIAGIIGHEFGWPVEPHPANWGGGSGPRWYQGHARNQAMVDLGADVCLAFPLAGSRGTYDCIKRAKHAGIPVVIYPVLILNIPREKP